MRPVNANSQDRVGKGDLNVRKISKNISTRKENEKGLKPCNQLNVKLKVKKMKTKIE